MDFVFELLGHGWAKATVVVGEQVAHSVPSYLTDALGDVVRAAVDLLRVRPDPRVLWDQEPVLTRWDLHRDGDNVRVLIREYDDGDEDDEEHGTVLIDASISVIDFCTAIADGARRLLAEVGEDGYVGSWGEHAFPAHELHDLDRLLTGDHGMPVRFGNPIDHVLLTVSCNRIAGGMGVRHGGSHWRIRRGSDCTVVPQRPHCLQS